MLETNVENKSSADAKECHILYSSVPFIIVFCGSPPNLLPFDVVLS